MSRLRDSRAALAALLLVSLLWAVGVLRGDLLPGLVPELLPRFEGRTLVFALMTLVAGLLSRRRGAAWPHGRARWSAVAVGLGMFVLPALLTSFARSWIPALAQTALLTLVPVFAAVFEPYLGVAAGAPVRHGLLAALAAVAGALLVFPVAVPNSVSAGAAFAAVILAAGCVGSANCLAVRLAREAPGKSMMPLAAVAGLTAAAAFGVASGLLEKPVVRAEVLGPELLWSAVVEVPGLLLLFWLLRRLSTVRMATRYVLSPLVAILVGSVLLRAGLGGRTCVGLLLMGGGAAWLVLAPEVEEESSILRLR